MLVLFDHTKAFISFYLFVRSCAAAGSGGTFISFYLLARGCAAACSEENIHFTLFAGARLRRGALGQKHLLYFICWRAAAPRRARMKHLLYFICWRAAAPRRAQKKVFILLYLLARGCAAVRSDENIYYISFVDAQPHRDALGQNNYFMLFVGARPRRGALG